MYSDSWIGLSGEWDLGIAVVTFLNHQLQMQEKIKNNENFTTCSANLPEKDEIGQWSIINGTAILSVK